VGEVVVRWSCDDALSGVVACPADVSVTGEGVHVITRSVADRAGNTSSAQVTIRIDRDPSTEPGTVQGTVTDRADGQPVVGASVTLRTTSNAIVATTTTGTDGRYAFPAVADGTYRIYAVLNKAYQGAYFPSTVPVAHGTSATVDLALTQALVISGTVRTPEGAPISGASVRVSPSGLAAITDATGSYRIAGNLPGTVTLRVLAHGSVPAAPSSFSLTEDRVVDHTLLPAPAGGGLKGTITAAAGGSPLAGATVRVWPKDAAAYGLTVTTGADGRFSVPSLPVGTYEVDVVRGSYQVRWFGDSHSRTGAAPVTITAGCAASPDLSWGDPCAVPVGIAMRR
jgi:5-hydroxyisourate hydrolase-like protein (transthyretin family)